MRSHEKLSATCAALAPTTTGAIARGKVRRRAPLIHDTRAGWFGAKCSGLRDRAGCRLVDPVRLFFFFEVFLVLITVTDSTVPLVGLEFASRFR